jgi:hypothetical protein
MSRPGDLDLMTMLARLLGVTREALASDDAAGVRARVDAVRAAVARLEVAGSNQTDEAPEGLGEEASAFRAALARAGIDPAAIGASGGASGGVANLAALARALETLTGWLENGRPEAGHEVDSLMAELDGAFGQMRLPGAAAAEARREERLRRDVQSSISQRLREAGIKPSDDT